MSLFIKLFLAHCMADFLFQPGSWIKDKREKKAMSPKLFMHIGVHILCMSFLVFNPKYLPGILVIAVLHYAIDAWKLTYSTKEKALRYFLIDQSLHLLVLVGVGEYYTGFISQLHTLENVERLLLLLLGVVLVTKASSFLIRLMIANWQPETNRKEEDSLSEAGTYIGMLERLFVFGFVITGNISAVGFLLGAKSIFRFGDLTKANNRKLTEYVLIGTLLSFGLAILIGVLYLKAKEYL